jgi:hypothetical protein
MSHRGKKGVPPLNPSSLKEKKPVTPPPQQQAKQPEPAAPSRLPSDELSAPPIERMHTSSPPDVSLPATVQPSRGDSEERGGPDANMMLPSLGDLDGPPLDGPPIVTEQEFIHTCNMIQFVAQPALVQVVRSLLEDFVWLVPAVRMRCDQAMSAFVAQQQALSPQGFAQQQQQQHLNTQQYMQEAGDMPPFGGGGPDGGMMMGGGGGGYGYPQQQHDSRQPRGGYGRSTGTSPGSSTRKNARGARNANRGEEDVDVCARHGNVRATKHLTYNASARQVECIPGFHCLETKPLPTSIPNGAGGASVAVPPPANGGIMNALPPPAPGAMNHHIGGSSLFGASSSAGSPINIGSGTPPPAAASGSGVFGSPPQLQVSQLDTPSSTSGTGGHLAGGLGGRATPKSQSMMGLTTPLLPSSTPTSIPPSPCKHQPRDSQGTPPAPSVDAEGDRARLEALLSNLRKT